MSPLSDGRTPVTVISGFLGAGKTTLVNHLIEQCAQQRIGIVVNEFGEVGIDGQLIVADEQALIEINNGCICCTVRADLVAGIKTLLATARDGRTPLDRLIVETSGLADPAPVLQTFLADPDLRAAVELESVVALVDARHFPQQIENEIAREQVAFADLVVVNKLDLVDDSQRAAIEARLKSLNPSATIRTATHSRLPVDALLGVRRFSLPAVLAIDPGLLDESATHDHEHDDSIRSCAIVEGQPLDPARFNHWVNQLVQQQGAQLMRMKGVLHFAEEARRFHFHSVHMLLDAQPGRAWRAGEARRNQLVFIGRNLDPLQLRESFATCVAI